VLLDLGDCAAARLAQERSLALFGRLDDRQGVAMALCGLADVASAEDDRATARRLYERSLAERLRIADRGGTAEALTGLGRLLLRDGATDQAGPHLAAGLAISSELGDRHGIARALEGLALLEREDAASSLPARPAIERQLIAAKQLLHGVVADAREAEACEIAPARSAGPAPVEALPRRRDGQLHKSADPLASDLTRREREVAALLAQGLTNRQIAERLVLTERTAETHVHNILSKLGLSSRAQIAVWAVANSVFAPADGWRRVAGM
ncbi:MAG TPA: helix-turn-helix transcriptional regulator, partial [Chloroflexota bacterium]|jgi:non-specific serine/threonine protein kinase